MTFSIAASIFVVIAIISVLFDVHITEKLASTGECGRKGKDIFSLCKKNFDQFHADGLSIVENVITEREMRALDLMYDRYMAEGSPDKQGRDFCDMSKPFETPRANYSVINGMLPRRYYPQFENNIYERVASRIAHQLFPDTEMVLDYDQLLDKMPGKDDAVFAWHQDMAYWPSPELTPDTRTVTFSLAMDTTTIENGCIRYVPGSGVSKTLRKHGTLGKDRDEAHALQLSVGPEEIVEFAQVKRGSVSIHDEYVVHGSSGNKSNGKRRTYVIAFRTKDTVTRERRAGFTHSHNDKVNWDKFNNWEKL